MTQYFKRIFLCDAGDNAELHSEDDSDQNDSVAGSNERSDDEASDVGDDERPVDGGSDGDGDGDGDEDEEEGNANAGWAEAMAKILGKKTPENKSSILVKNKELDRVKEKERQEQLERKKQVLATLEDLKILRLPIAQGHFVRRSIFL